MRCCGLALPRTPRISGRAVAAARQRGGFLPSHTRGNHHYLRRPGAQRLVVFPVHGNQTVPVGTLLSILRQAELSNGALMLRLAHRDARIERECAPARDALRGVELPTAVADRNGATIP
ncbi:MAG: type II toxin-antitoxin system HicA family toxin [Candidatus Eremiobacteraeota bacterium]|nr:type II toxin-antitoxin system HicA family toxin [Candidatus Eremiobacteraeota bacterium]